MLPHGLADIVSGSAWQPGPLRPIQFPSWVTTCGHLVVAITNGPGLILLVGPAGCGKTYTLVAVASGTPRRETAIRNPDEALRPGVAVDMVDDVEAEAIDGLLEPPLGVVRILAIRPELVSAIRSRRPDARVVPVQPMTRRDLRDFVNVRRSELPAAVDAYVLRALAKLPDCGVRTPGVADRLIERICDEAAADRSRRATSRWRGRIEPPAWSPPQDHDAASPYSGPVPDSGPAPRSPEPPRPGASRGAGAGGFESTIPSAGSYASGVRATFDAPGSRFRRGVGALRRRNLSHQAEPVFDATSWDMLQAVPAIIEQVGPSALARRRTRLIGAGSLVVAAVLGLTLAVQPEIGSAVARLRDGLTTAVASYGPAAAPSTTVLTAPPSDALQPVPPQAVAALTASDEAPQPGWRRTPEPVVAPSPPATAESPPTAPHRDAVEVVAEPAIATPEPGLTAPAESGLQAAGPASAPPPVPISAEPGPLRAAVAPAQGLRRPTPEAQRAEAADPARLLHLGQMLLAIGQDADGRKMLEAAAERGSGEAANLIAAHGWAKPAHPTPARAATRSPARAGR